VNDFTKEELHLLLAWSVNRSQSVSGVEFCREGSGLLFDKIQLIIKNYCEHEKCPNPNCNLSNHAANVSCIEINE
jgi:hypothetical protein